MLNRRTSLVARLPSNSFLCILKLASSIKRKDPNLYRMLRMLFAVLFYFLFSQALVFYKKRQRSKFYDLLNAVQWRQ